MSVLTDIANKQIARTWRGRAAIAAHEPWRVSAIVAQGAYLIENSHYSGLLAKKGGKGKAGRELRDELGQWVRDQYGGWAIILRLLVPLIVQILLNLVTGEET